MSAVSSTPTPTIWQSFAKNFTEQGRTKELNAAIDQRNQLWSESAFTIGGSVKGVNAIAREFFVRAQEALGILVSGANLLQDLLNAGVNLADRISLLSKDGMIEEGSKSTKALVSDVFIAFARFAAIFAPETVHKTMEAWSKVTASDTEDLPDSDT